MYEQYWQKLQHCSIVQDVPWEDISPILDFLKPEVRSFPRGTLIRYEGTTAEDMGLILSGEVLQVRIKSGGERAIFEHLLQGQMFGEIILFCPHRTEWPSDVVAKTDCQIMFFSRENIFCERSNMDSYNPKIILNLITNICGRMEQLMITLRCLKSRSVRQKVATYLYEQILLCDKTHLTLKFNRDELADYLFIPRPSLSRELSNMKEDGIINYHKENITVLDMDLLKECL